MCNDVAMATTLGRHYHVTHGLDLSCSSQIAETFGGSLPSNEQETAVTFAGTIYLPTSDPETFVRQLKLLLDLHIWGDER